MASEAEIKRGIIARSIKRYGKGRMQSKANVDATYNRTHRPPAKGTPAFKPKKMAQAVGKAGVAGPRKPTPHGAAGPKRPPVSTAPMARRVPSRATPAVPPPHAAANPKRIVTDTAAGLAGRPVPKRIAVPSAKPSGGVTVQPFGRYTPPAGGSGGGGWASASGLSKPVKPKKAYR